MQDGLTVYTDAARDDTVTGIAYVISGEVNLEGCRSMEGNYTSMDAEYHALMEGLRVASQASRSNTGVTAYVDVKPLISKMQTPDEKSELWRERRIGFNRMVGKFDEHDLEWIPREQNRRADELAREALFEGRQS